MHRLPVSAAGNIVLGQYITRRDWLRNEISASIIRDSNRKDTCEKVAFLAILKPC
jgi:hypothetical protein